MSTSKKESKMLNIQPLRRRLPALWVAGLIALACCGTALAARSSSSAHHPSKPKSMLAGKWTGSYGGAVSGHFTIHWKQAGSKLTGTIKLSNPSGTYGIGGSVKQGKIKFGAVSVGAKYKGTFKGKSMSGTWTSPEGGGRWSASKS